MTRGRRLLLLVVSGCAARGAPPSPAAVATSPKAESAPAAAMSSPAPAAAPVPATPTLLLTEPGLMAALEERGLTLSELLGGERASNDELARLPAFAPVVRELGRELKDVAARDPAAGVEVARFSHRLFDERFLRRREARFALAGVVNRPDRAPFAKESCGELRLVYRLSYALGDERASKLPMTLGVELTVPREPDGCRAAARRWVEPSTAGVAPRADWLRSTDGPLSSERLRLAPERTRVVINLQLVRWPSTVRPDLGGHAEYLLRSFRPNRDGVLAVEPLENTPDVEALRGPEPRRSLEQWLRQNATSVDEGLALLPVELSAKRALSVTPRGLERLANRPFTQVLHGQGATLEAGRFVRSPWALERRLDQLSCQGCHQARSVAGFHLLGEDPTDAPSENALALPVSPHVTADLPRRLRVARQMLAGEEPDFAAPFAERAGEPGRYGDACALGDDPSFASWTCDAGLSCSAIAARPGEPIGQCLPASPEAGDACERGSVSPSANRLRDRVGRVEEQSCGAMVCNRSQVGFPGGMCTGACGDSGTSCGAIAILEPFNACLARGESFIGCIRGNIRPAGLRACSADETCRDDYVCARGRAAVAGAGVCLPPYFVFQLRVDGHSSRP